MAATRGMWEVSTGVKKLNLDGAAYYVRDSSSLPYTSSRTFLYYDSTAESDVSWLSRSVRLRWYRAHTGPSSWRGCGIGRLHGSKCLAGQGTR